MQSNVLPREDDLDGHRAERAPNGEATPDLHAAAAAASVDEDELAEESHCARLLRHLLFALWEWASTGTLTHLRPARSGVPPASIRHLTRPRPQVLKCVQYSMRAHQVLSIALGCVAVWLCAPHRWDLSWDTKCVRSARAAASAAR